MGTNLNVKPFIGDCDRSGGQTFVPLHFVALEKFFSPLYKENEIVPQRNATSSLTIYTKNASTTQKNLSQESIDTN